MIELPEAFVLAGQIKETLAGKTIRSAAAGAHRHGFAWYSGDPAEYAVKLAGKCITGSAAYGGRVEIWAEEMIISFFDGVRARFHAPGAKRPDKHQLMVDFDDGSAFSCSVQMYGGILAFEDGTDDSSYYKAAKEKPSPYSGAFDKAYFDSLRREVKPNISVKAFLATEQRIPGFGNGVLHDVLWNARIHPKRKLDTLTDANMDALFKSLTSTLTVMRDCGGRDTEKDLYGQAGGYCTVLSGKTLAFPCRTCGGGLKREAYLGGNIYFCPTCQQA